MDNMTIAQIFQTATILPLMILGIFGILIIKSIVK